MKRLLALALPLVLAACGGAVPRAEAPREGPRGAALPAIAERPELRQCVADLGKTGSQFSPLPDRYYGAGCQTLGTVHLSALGGDRGALSVSNLGPVACPLANSFAGWARYGVDRAARAVYGEPLVRIETMGSYSCRTVAGTQRLSAHARAEAIDVAAFVLADGHRISVLEGWSGDARDREFLRTIHESACKRFGTVLGPNYNAAHKNHLHLELGGGTFCR